MWRRGVACIPKNSGYKDHIISLLRTLSCWQKLTPENVANIGNLCTIVNDQDKLKLLPVLNKSC